MNNRILLIIFLVLLTAGCATTGQFAYDRPEGVPEIGRGKIIASMMPIQDKREGEKEIDKIYAEDPLKDIEKIIRDELMSTGLFKDISFISGRGVNGNAEILIEPSLTRMDWEVPGYNGMIETAFVVSFLTGGVGGMIYGSTSTDVHGYTSLHVRIIRQPSDNVLIDKTYDGHSEEKMAKLKCDTGETKAAIVGKALKNGIEALKLDVKEKLADVKAEMSIPTVFNK